MKNGWKVNKNHVGKRDENRHMTQPSWIVTTLVGVIAGYLVPYFVRVLLYLVSRFQHTPLDGKWYAYRFTNRDKGLQLQHNTWRIRRGYSTKYVVESFYEGLKDPVYKGNVSLERNFWLVKLKAVKHDEEVQIRLFAPIPTQDIYTWGLSLAVDFLGNPISRPFVISRRELTDEEAEDLLIKKAKINSKYKILSL